MTEGRGHSPCGAKTGRKGVQGANRQSCFGELPVKHSGRKELK